MTYGGTLGANGVTERGHGLQGMCGCSGCHQEPWVWKKMQLHRPQGQLTWGPGAAGGRRLAAAIARSPGVSEEDGTQRSLWG